MNWENKKVIITGGSSGIGAHLVSVLEEKGANIVFVGLEKDRVEKIAERKNALGLTADLTKEEELTFFFQKAIEHLGGIDLLVNNAGFVIAKPFEELNRSDFEKMFAINTIAPARLAQLALPYFRQNKKGDIVTIGATGAYYAFDNGTAYSASKAALSIVSKNLVLEYRKENIRTFHIDPSWCTDTHNGNFGSPIPKEEDKLNPMDVADMILNVLEMNRRAFVPQMSIWGTKP
jgi:3-oxoacyl-[acyl-carrier protein] reductase|tara:strand:+ start:639 stop:1337 length:699 start_codon:yes stop_codon:yes gene_type:complete